jgi:integrase
VAQIEFDYMVSDRDRHGSRRWYVRMPGKRKVRLRAEPGSEAFIEEYWAARRGDVYVEPAQPKAKRGTFRWLVDHYYASQAFADLDAAYTRVERRRHLDPLVEKIGDKSAMIPLHKIREGVRERERSAARKWIAALRHVYQGAIEDGVVDRDPTFGVKVKKPVTPGFHSWTIEDCLAYEKRWRLGTQQRKAYAIGLYLGCRRSDAVRIGRQHEREKGTEVAYTQHKGRNRAPVEVVHPIVPPLREALNACKTKGLLWLETAYGKQRSDKAFGNDFATWCADAGLPPGRTFHGLRKALAARLAEHGYTTNQINAVLGDKTLQQAEVYTRAAEKKRMAREALVGLFGEQKRSRIVPPVARGGTKTRKKS